jgi:beta-lactam-binding protein with PASTA domain
MKLGDSLQRRRRRPRGSRSDERPGEGRRARWSWTGGRSFFPWLRGRNLIIGVVALALVGWLFGYGIATRVLFPAPPPPGDLVEVPDLRGLGLTSASERLAGLGLEVGTVDSLQHPSVAAGLVLGQSPLPGQVLRPEQPVRLAVSMGPQTRSVPDVLGLNSDRARIVLESSGFIVTVDTAEAEEVRGNVVAISPGPGEDVALPAEVRVTVSAGPPVVAMPYVLGMERAEAEAVLDSLGLVVSDVEEVFRFGRDQGIVVEQEPAAETELERGSSVRLTVGRGGREDEEQ